MSSSSGVAARANAEIPIGEKWDHSIENLVRKTATGFAVGTVSALLCRTHVGRMISLFSCAGFGAGMAYSEARYLFDYDIAFDRRHVVSVALYPPPAVGASKEPKADKA